MKNYMTEQADKDSITPTRAMIRRTVVTLVACAAIATVVLVARACFPCVAEDIYVFPAIGVMVLGLVFVSPSLAALGATVAAAATLGPFFAVSAVVSIAQAAQIAYSDASEDQDSEAR
jgi:hypothetical protein